MKCPLPWYLDVTLVTLTRCWHVASFRCVRASSTCGGKEVEAGHWMPDWCWSHLFPGKHWCCCGRSLWWNRVPSISIYHLVSGVGNTTILLGQLGIAICYRWERFNPLTTVCIYIYVYNTNHSAIQYKTIACRTIHIPKVVGNFVFTHMFLIFQAQHLQRSKEIVKAESEAEGLPEVVLQVKPSKDRTRHEATGWKVTWKQMQT